jgi:hypothetical protein
VPLDGTVLITLDRKIRYRELERTALMNAGVKAFIVTTTASTAGSWRAAREAGSTRWSASSRLAPRRSLRS